jgi:hypothetical protein
MDRNIRRWLGVFVSSGILSTGLVLAAGGTAFASDNGSNGGPGGDGGNGGQGENSLFVDGGNGGIGGDGGAGGNGGDSWAGSIGCNTFLCNHPAGVSRCAPVVTWRLIHVRHFLIDSCAAWQVGRRTEFREN